MTVSRQSQDETAVINWLLIRKIHYHIFSNFKIRPVVLF